MPSARQQIIQSKDCTWWSLHQEQEVHQARTIRANNSKTAAHHGTESYMAHQGHQET